MKKEILISLEANEKRMAILEDGKLEEFFIERAESHRMFGNIYKGKVKSIVPGIQAAFIDLGTKKDGFLYVADAVESPLDIDSADENCDIDGDGHVDIYKGGDDCNDNDETVNPQAIEICDGLDNDCDGNVDEGSNNVLDSDNDGMNDICDICIEETWLPVILDINDDNRGCVDPFLLFLKNQLNEK